MLIHNSPTLRHRSICLLISTARIRGYSIWSQDVSQEYIQSEGLTKNVYVKPQALFKLEESTILKLEKPIYGLTEAGDYWSNIIVPVFN